MMETLQAMIMMELSKKMGGSAEEGGLVPRRQHSATGQGEEEELTKGENRKSALSSG